MNGQRNTDKIKRRLIILTGTIICFFSIQTLGSVTPGKSASPLATPTPTISSSIGSNGQAVNTNTGEDNNIQKSNYAILFKKGILTIKIPLVIFIGMLIIWVCFLDFIVWVLFWLYKRLFRKKDIKNSQSAKESDYHLKIKVDVNIEGLDGYFLKQFPFPQSTVKTGLNEDVTPKVDNVFEKESDQNKYISDLVELYNKATQNEGYQNSFMDTYKPIRSGFNEETVMQLGRGKESVLLLEERDDGDYLMIDLTKIFPGIYLVVPRFSLVFNDTLYKAGAMGTVFKCEGYDGRYRFKSIMLIEPARFYKKGNFWVLDVAGSLILKQEESIY